ncbi:UNVERIFIED_CONTAM: hypothetical protein GTU68_040232 [Idotea baltica]|nr:hypothetical protein [Idotea baltica]
MAIREALTFDDVLLVPAESAIIPSQADTRTQVTKNIALNIPLLSSAMDTVTEFEMAIAMAQAGGMGVIHRNLDVEEQARQVGRVKRFEQGVVHRPIILTPEQTLADARALQAEHGISGFPDIEKSTLNPHATKDELGRLRVAAASTVGDTGFERSAALIDAGVDLLVIDTAHGHSKSVSAAVEQIKKHSNSVQVVAGTSRRAKPLTALDRRGADAIKWLSGHGIQSFRRALVAGVGVPPVTAILDCAEEGCEKPAFRDRK